jgi:Tfp pilus assembly protein PilF
MDAGQPVPEPVSVALQCGVRPLQVIKSDLKGYFEFTLGEGPQGNADFNASDDTSFSQGTGGVQPSGGGSSHSGGLQDVLTGCEVQVSVSGYQPMSKTITGRTDVAGINMGTLQLTRIAGVTGSSISVTSLLVPNGARKEFEKGDKDAHSNHLDSATQHLEKATAEYDKYAAAWNELGNLYATAKESEKSQQAFEKAIAADPHYIPPYLGLAQLELQNQQYELAVETAGRALELDPSIGDANFIQAVGNFKLNRLDAAEKSAQMAEKGPHQNMSDLHALHASILIQKQDYPGAAAQARAYLKEFPQGRFADQMKNELQQIEKLQGSATSTSASGQPQIAP